MKDRNETTTLLSSEEFDILSKKQAAISNVSRGAVINQTAMIKALEEGKIRAAFLDVADPEPLPADNPLWDAPNCIITPHVSGGSTAYISRAVQLMITNLERKLSGQPLYNVVDRKKGY
jgi:phosphoglycerate dehydrogenase-like enzyme